MEAPQRAVAQDAARALRESAASHKRAAGMHRKAARRSMEALARLERACEALGIKLIEA